MYNGSIGVSFSLDWISLGGGIVDGCIYNGV